MNTFVKILVPLALASITLAAPAAPKVDGKIASGEYANTYKHDKSGIVVNWTIVGDTIYFGIESPSDGWTGIGFNPTGSKKDGADMYMWMMDGGKFSIQDMTETKPTGAPKLDTDEGGKNNILESAGGMSGKTMIAEFSRKLNTGDKTDEAIVVGKPNTVLLAIGDSPSYTKAHKRTDRWETEITFK